MELFYKTFQTFLLMSAKFLQNLFDASKVKSLFSNSLYILENALKVVYYGGT